jgi:hypothetical protein
LPRAGRCSDWKLNLTPSRRDIHLGGNPPWNSHFEGTDPAGALTVNERSEGCPSTHSLAGSGAGACTGIRRLAKSGGCRVHAMAVQSRAIRVAMTGEHEPSARMSFQQLEQGADIIIGLAMDRLRVTGQARGKRIQRGVENDQGGPRGGLRERALQKRELPSRDRRLRSSSTRIPPELRPRGSDPWMVHRHHIPVAECDRPIRQRDARETCDRVVPGADGVRLGQIVVAEDHEDG